MIIQIVLLIIGFIVLIKGADIFVDGASSVASNFKIPKMIIGLTIVAFGTSAPELAVSLKSIMSNSDSLAIGNVIGSNIFNILFILGVCSIIKSMKVKNATVKKEIPMTLMVTILLSILISDNLFNSASINVLSRSDGFVILLFFCVFIYYLFSTMRKSKVEKEEAKYKLGKSLILTLLGIIAIVAGSNIVVDSAIEIAEYFKISERVIGLTIIAIGTSLPELVTSIVALRKGETDIAIGNIIGSNIFNIGIVLGLPIAVFGGINALGFTSVDVVTFLVSVIMLFILSYNDLKISRFEGILMLLVFFAYYTYVIFA